MLTKTLNELMCYLQSADTKLIYYEQNMQALWRRALKKKLRTWKMFSKCAKFGTKLTRFEIFI